MNLNKLATEADNKIDKDEIKAKTDKLKEEIGQLQDVLFAERKHALLVVLQGMDASGKDGVVKKVFDAVNPAGCNVFPFKVPTEIEASHDFLWRVHNKVPPKGMIHIFNRSHYEAILIERVHKWIDEKTVEQRIEHINDFEKLLTQCGTTILKFYLHVSKDEQLKRLKERISDPTKNWKYNEGDLKERELWDDYMKAYEDVIEKCSKAVEWHVIPSDQNWYKEYLISEKICETLKTLKMKYPEIKKK